MTSKYNVTYDSEKETAILVHMPNKIVRFRQMSNGLYALNPLSRDSYTTTNKFQFVETVEENLGFFTPRQQERAKKARAFYRALGTPSLDELKAMIRLNLIKNNSITTEDINLAGRAFRSDVATLKSKTTRTNPAPAVSNLVEIPDELLETHQDVTISMDGLTVNSLKFLSTILHDIYYHTAQYVSQPIASVYKNVLMKSLVHTNVEDLKSWKFTVITNFIK